MTELDNIISTLKSGGNIIYPTDTTWGLGCDATNGKAVEKLYKIKKRSPDDPFTILVEDLDMLHHYVEEVHPRLETLLVYHQRPLTVIYNNTRHLPSNLHGTNRSAAIRVTLDPFCKAVIRELGKPIVATSASLSKEPFPQSFRNIDFHLLNQVDYVVKYKQDLDCFEDPSVVVRLTERSELEFIRT